MERYTLAKIALWAGAGGIQGRKRLQKVVFFLKVAGCPLDADYTLHHYGPYSRDVAEACDELVGAGILAEGSSPNNVGTQYSYNLTPAGVAAIETTERRQGGDSLKLDQYRSLAVELIEKDLWELELGSTILFFQDQNHGSDWGDAVRRACEFKKIDPKVDRTVSAATSLARRVFQEGNQLR